MADAFTYYLGTRQGRVQPIGHDVDPSDVGRAEVETGLSEPFALIDLDTLEVEVDGGTAQQIQFNTADFADITNATASEVAAVLDTAILGATVDVQGTRVRISSDTSGADSSVHVTDGTARFALRFPQIEVTGFTGAWTFVFGCDTALVETFQSGDEVRITQDQARNDDKRVRLVGKVRWPSTMPAGYAWAVFLDVEGDVVEYRDPNVVHSLSTHLEEQSVNDVAQTFGGTFPDPSEIKVGVRLVDVGGGAGVDVESELPALYLDAVQLDETLDDLSLSNRVPVPGTDAWPLDYPEVRLDVSNVSASSLDLTATQVYIEGVLAYDGGAGGFQTGFSGTVTGSLGPGGETTRFVIDWTGASFQPLSSEQVINVRVVADTVATGSDIDETYQFTMADTVQPRLVSAASRSATVVRLAFDEAMDEDTVEVATNYDFQVRSAPAVAVTAASAEQVSTTEVDVTLDWEMTQGAEYLVTAANVEDLQGNVVDPAYDEATFVGYYCPRPTGRDFDYWKMIPSVNRREDATRALRNFALSIQDVIDLLLCSIDRWTDIFDVDVAPEDFVDAILGHLGNPFNFPDIALIDKRRLGRILVDIYKSKGTEPGIVDAVRFFLGIDVTLDIVNDRSFWELGVSTLGIDTTLGPEDGSPLWYTFFIVSPVVLTDEQRARILSIADYMKAPHEHIGGIIEPGSAVPPPSFWILGVSELGIDTVLTE